MKTYLSSSDTNYGLMILIINAENQEDATKLADKAGAWPGRTVVEVDTATPGVVHKG